MALTDFNPQIIDSAINEVVPSTTAESLAASFNPPAQFSPGSAARPQLTSPGIQSFQAGDVTSAPTFGERFNKFSRENDLQGLLAIGAKALDPEGFGGRLASGVLDLREKRAAANDRAEGRRLQRLGIESEIAAQKAVGRRAEDKLAMQEAELRRGREIGQLSAMLNENKAALANATSPEQQATISDRIDKITNKIVSLTNPQEQVQLTNAGVLTGPAKEFAPRVVKGQFPGGQPGIFSVSGGQATPISVSGIPSGAPSGIDLTTPITGESFAPTTPGISGGFIQPTPPTANFGSTTVVQTAEGPRIAVIDRERGPIVTRFAPPGVSSRESAIRFLTENDYEVNEKSISDAIRFLDAKRQRSLFEAEQKFKPTSPKAPPGGQKKTEAEKELEALLGE